jgi:hypothetical protein
VLRPTTGSFEGGLGETYLRLVSGRVFCFEISASTTPRSGSPNGLDAGGAYREASHRRTFVERLARIFIQTQTDIKGRSWLGAAFGSMTDDFLIYGARTFI